MTLPSLSAQGHEAFSVGCRVALSVVLVLFCPEKWVEKKLARRANVNRRKVGSRRRSISDSNGMDGGVGHFYAHRTPYELANRN